MEKRKVYLDTSVISAYFDSRTPERQRLTREAWSSIEACTVFISEIVINELKAAPEELRKQFLSAVKNFTILKVNKEAETLAQGYIDHGIINKRYFDDALHVAIASVNMIQYLLSWNYKHLVNVKTRKLVALFNATKNYHSIEIITPPEL